MKDNKVTINEYINKVFLWMFAGLVITAITSYITVSSIEILEFLFSSTTNIYILFGLEILAVIVISKFKEKLSPTFLLVLFFVYSIINGLTFSVIFLVYELGSIALIFLVTALLFAGLAIFGYVTKKDMTKVGHICIVGLIVIIIASIVNIFLKNSTFDLILTIVGLIIFIGLTIYDMQKIKNFYLQYEDNDEMLKKMSIHGALELYLDFINIFIRLLSLFGKKRGN